MGINLKTDLKLFQFYRQLLKMSSQTWLLLILYKPNIYGSLACSMAGIPYCANVQDLGTEFQ